MLRTKKIVYIEDSEEDRLLLKRYLKKSMLNAELYESDNAVEGIQLINEISPNCILLDYHLPGITADELIQTLKESGHTNTGIVVLTGRMDPKAAVSCIQSGAHDYIGKEELSPETIRRAIGNAMDKVKLQKQVEKNKLLAIQNSKLASLGIVAGGVAHEINNPLTIIDGYLTMLSRFLKANEIAKCFDTIEKIKKTSHRIADIVKGLQSFSGELSHEKLELVTAQTILDRTEEFCHKRLKRKNIKLEILNHTHDEKVRCSDVQVTQILLNLIFNAADEIEQSESPWIKMQVEKVNESLVFSIIDSGKGINKSIQENLMTPFFTTKEIGKGTGLGLSISKGIAEKYHGKLEYDGQSNNTCFKLTLPISVEEPLEISKAS